MPTHRIAKIVDWLEQWPDIRDELLVLLADHAGQDDIATADRGMEMVAQVIKPFLGSTSDQELPETTA
jgi:hypothetical protein